MKLLFPLPFDPMSILMSLKSTFCSFIDLYPLISI